MRAAPPVGDRKVRELGVPSHRQGRAATMGGDFDAPDERR